MRHDRVRCCGGCLLAVGKPDADTGLILLNSDAVMVGQQPVGSGARTEASRQRHLQIAAMDENCGIS